MSNRLKSLESAVDLHRMSVAELNELAEEIREVLCRLVATRSAHFASNLGVVELCLALHSVYDFREDRLIWDTGHQIYPHKLVTGRAAEFGSIRTKGGLMGYPNPQESPYDLFMTGHAGCSISTVLGLRSGDQLLGHAGRHAVAVIGDGAFPSGIVYEAMNNVTAYKEKLLVVLNDNEMSICPRVGGVGRIPGSAADQSVLHRIEIGGRADPEQDARAGRSRGTISGAGQGSRQGGTARRHAV